MTDPLRFSDDADPALSQLLRAGQKEMPPRRALEKTIAGLGAATTVVGATQAAGAAVAASKLSIWTLATWAGAGVLSGAVTIGGVEIVQHGIESSRRQAVAHTAAMASKPARPAAEPHAGAAPAPAPSPAPSPASESASPGQREPGALVVGGEQRDVRGVKPSGHPRAPIPHSPSEASEIDSTISIEIALIDEARRALQAGRAASALQALNRHRTEVKRQRLAPEAQYLEMEAHFASGNPAAARAAARALLARYPKGPHAARAQVLLGTDGKL